MSVWNAASECEILYDFHLRVLCDCMNCTNCINCMNCMNCTRDELIVNAIVVSETEFHSSISYWNFYKSLQQYSVLFLLLLVLLTFPLKVSFHSPIVGKCRLWAFYTFFFVNFIIHHISPFYLLLFCLFFHLFFHFHFHHFLFEFAYI